MFSCWLASFGAWRSIDGHWSPFVFSFRKARVNEHSDSQGRCVGDGPVAVDTCLLPRHLRCGENERVC